MKTTNILASNTNYIIVNKGLIQKLGRDAALLLGELCEEYDYYKTEDRLSPDGFFYSTIENVENNTSLKSKKQRDLVNILTETGALSVDLRGLPAKRYFKINEQVLENLVKTADEERNALLKMKNQDCSNIPNKIIEDNQQIIIDTNSNNINSNNTKNNITRLPDTIPFGQDSKGGDVIPYPNLEDINELLELKEYNSIDDNTKNIILILAREIYSRYSGEDEEKITLLYDWLIELFASCRGIRKTQLIQNLEQLDKLDRETQLINIKICMVELYPKLGNDYSKYLGEHPNFLKFFEETRKMNEKPTRNPIDILDLLVPDEDLDTWTNCGPF